MKKYFRNFFNIMILLLLLCVIYNHWIMKNTIESIFDFVLVITLLIMHKDLYDKEK